jgi:transcriptional regulator with XRE-family HTH domain
MAVMTFQSNITIRNEGGLGWYLRLARRDLGLTQKQMAQVLGTGTTSIREWEKGRRQPQLTSLERIARLLGDEISDLLGMVEHPPHEVTMRKYYGRPGEAGHN